jgi:Ca2+-binding EF-hand superfamily protein
LVAAGAQAQAAPADARSLFTKVDADKDGKVSKDEAKMLPAVSGRFDELDKDKDGFLSMDEFSAAVKPDAMK